MKKIILFSAMPVLVLSLTVWSADSKSPVTDQEQKTTPINKPASPLADQVPWLSINDGGDLNLSSTNYKVSVTIGQTAIGYGNGASHDMSLGFWYGACVARPGDANASNTYTLADAIAIVNYVFNKAGCVPLPTCWLSGLLCRGDWNGSGTVTLGDAIRGVNYIFNKPGGPWNALAIGACCL